MTHRLTRRSLMRSGSCLGFSLALPAGWFPRSLAGQVLKIGLIADLHLGLFPDAPRRLASFLAAMQDYQPDAVIQLGDFAFPNPEHAEAADQLNRSAATVLHTIGNHDLDLGLTRADCQKVWKIPAPYYATRIGPIRVLVLDGNEPGSPTHEQHGGYSSYIGPAQLQWLASQLERETTPTLIVSHQGLAGQSSVDNAAEIQKLLANYKDRIMLCLNGHSHVDQCLEVEGIRYLHVNSASYFWLGGKTRWAAYRDPLFARLTLDPGRGQIRIEGISSRWTSTTPDSVDYFQGKPTELKTLVVPQIRNREFRSPALQER